MFFEQFILLPSSLSRSSSEFEVHLQKCQYVDGKHRMKWETHLEFIRKKYWMVSRPKKDRTRKEGRLVIEDGPPKLITNGWIVIVIIMIFNQMTSLIASCRYQSDVDKQIRILHTINSALPKSLRLQMPSLLTNDYIGRALDIIEDRMLPHVSTPADIIL
jgi:hypothetical protein